MLAGVVFVCMHHAQVPISANSSQHCWAQQCCDLLRPFTWALKVARDSKGHFFEARVPYHSCFVWVNKHLKRNLLAHLLTWSVAIVTTSHFEPENVFLQETYFLTIYSIDLNHTNSSYYKEIEAYSELGLLWSFKYLKSYSYFTSFSSQNIG